MFTGASQPDAEKALSENGNNVVDAIAALTVVPSITGTKHIPPAPIVNNGHDAETLERIRLGRLMSDMLSASPKNDLRGRASHYPAKEPQTEAVVSTVPTVPASSASQSSPQTA